MVARFQIIDSLMWQPPPGVDPATVRFHVEGYGTEGGRVDLDEVMQRRTDVIAEWDEPDGGGNDRVAVAAVDPSGDPLRSDGGAGGPRPVWFPIERDTAALAARVTLGEPA